MQGMTRCHNCTLTARVRVNSFLYPLPIPLMGLVVVTPGGLSAQAEVLQHVEKLQNARSTEPEHEPLGTVLDGCPPQSPRAPESHRRGLARIIRAIEHGRSEELSKMRKRLYQV